MNIETFYSSSAGNLYRLSTEGEAPLLIECGVPFRSIQKALDFKLSDIAGCLISHAHADHAKATPDILASGIDCYMSRETKQALAAIPEGHHRVRIIDPLKPVGIESWRVLPFPTQHDAEGSLGFLIASGNDKILYATDTYYIRNRFRGLTHIAVECNYSKRTLAPDLHPIVKRRLIRSHFSLENVLKFLQANDLSLVREIWLLHLSAGNSDEVLFKREVERATGKPCYVAGEKA